jgi:hypothetical protein
VHIIIKDKLTRYVSFEVLKEIKNLRNPEIPTYECVDLVGLVYTLARNFSCEDALMKPIAFVIKLLSSSTDIECIRLPVGRWLELNNELKDHQKYTDPKYADAGFVNVLIHGVPIISAIIPEDTHEIYYKKDGTTPESLKAHVNNPNQKEPV